MWSRVISAPFNTWKLPRAFSTRDALNKTCSFLPFSGPISFSDPISVALTGEHTIAASTRLYTNPRLHSRSVFLSLPLLFPWSRFNTFRPVPLWSFVYYIGNRVSLSSLLSLRPSYLPQPSPSHQPGRGLASNLVLRRFSSTLRGQRSCSLFGSTMQKFPTAPATAK